MSTEQDVDLHSMTLPNKCYHPSKDIEFMFVLSYMILLQTCDMCLFTTHLTTPDAWNRHMVHIRGHSYACRATQGHPQAHRRCTETGVWHLECVLRLVHRVSQARTYFMNLHDILGLMTLRSVAGVAQDIKPNCSVQCDLASFEASTNSRKRVRCSSSTSRCSKDLPLRLTSVSMRCLKHWLSWATFIWLSKSTSPSHTPESIVTLRETQKHPQYFQVCVQGEWSIL